MSPVLQIYTDVLTNRHVDLELLAGVTDRPIHTTQKRDRLGNTDQNRRIFSRTGKLFETKVDP